MSHPLRRLDERLFPRGGQLNPILRRTIRRDWRVLDVGCGDRGALPQRVPGIEHLEGVDLKVPDADTPEPRHLVYHRADVRTIAGLFEPRSFDCVVALDVVEHLTREEGVSLLEDMERIASGRVVVFTPNGFLPQPPDPDNPHQEHVSGWRTEDFSARGYRVWGINGWRPLRGMYALVRWKPHAFWWRASVLSERFVTRRPGLAFQLLAVKEIRRG